MPDFGTVEYQVEPFGKRFRVVSMVWNKGMFGAPQWFRNFVADCDSPEDANEIIEKISGSAADG